MRIITGIYKGRRFDVPRTFKARPTTDFAKENIFNVINGYLDLDGADALDHCAFIRQCLQKLGTEVVSLVRGDVFKFVTRCREQFDIVFADPPYTLEGLSTLPSLILKQGLLKENGILVFEHGSRNDFSHEAGFVEHRAYGSVNFSIFRATAQTVAQSTPTDE